MHYDGNCGAFFFSLIVSSLWLYVRIRDFLMLIFWTTMWQELQKIRAWSHTPGSCQIFIQTPCSGKNRGSVTKLAIILHPQNIDGSIHPQPVPLWPFSSSTHQSSSWSPERHWWRSEFSFSPGLQVSCHIQVLILLLFPFQSYLLVFICHCQLNTL